MTSLADQRRVEALLGRAPRADYEVVVRNREGEPVVIRNAPLLADGTPMPTRYWLVGDAEREAVSRLEAAGGVREAEAAVDPAELEDAHRRYGEERDRALPAGHAGPRPTGGVGGTRRGVKCLHAHYAWFLAGGDDPVGRWVAERLAAAAPPAGGTVAVARPAGATVAGASPAAPPAGATVAVARPAGASAEAAAPPAAPEEQ